MVATTTGGQEAEDIPHRQVETEGGDGQHAVARAHRENSADQRKRQVDEHDERIAMIVEGEEKESVHASDDEERKQADIPKAAPGLFELAAEEKSISDGQLHLVS